MGEKAVAAGGMVEGMPGDEFERYHTPWSGSSSPSAALETVHGVFTTAVDAGAAGYGERGEFIGMIEPQSISHRKSVPTGVVRQPGK
jgi:hypothetical protein